MIGRPAESIAPPCPRPEGRECCLVIPEISSGKHPYSDSAGVYGVSWNNIHVYQSWNFTSVHEEANPLLLAHMGVNQLLLVRTV